MLYGIIWLILIELIGISTFVIFLKLFKAMPDKGYSISKPLGIILISLISWLISLSKIVPVTEATAVVLLISLVTCSGLIGAVKWRLIKQVVANNCRIILLIEIVFILTYLIFFAIRYSDPGINHTEQPMDFAFLNASINTYMGEPLDPWFKGEKISYYYFGYWIFGTLTKISQLPSFASYNLALATIPALTASILFALTAMFLKISRHRFDLSVIACSVLATSCGILMANLQGILEFFRINSVGSVGFWKTICIDGMQNPVMNSVDSWRPTEFWWWFKTSRVINYFGPTCEGEGLDYTINEFPFFSYLLGDLHPHIMVTPFLLVFLYLVYNLYKQNAPIQPNVSYWTKVGIIGASLGCVCFINMWMLPVCVSVLAGVFLLSWLSPKSFNSITLVKSIFFIMGISMLILLPYFWSFQSSVNGLSRSAFQTSGIHGFIVWGPLFILCLPQVIWSFSTTTIGKTWKSDISFSIAITGLPWLIRFLIPESNVSSEANSMINFAIPVTIFCFISNLTLLNLTRREGLTSRNLILSIFSLSMMLILVPELFYIGDVYGNRMNTVFKLYYPVWIFLSICSGYSIYQWARGNIRTSKLLKYPYTLIACLIVLGAFYYTPAAAMTKIGESNISGFIESDSGLEESQLSALKYAKTNIAINQGILESVGEWDRSGFISRNTGIANIVNWPGHQNQWRDSNPDVYQRAADVETIYSTEDTNQAKSLLSKYQIDFVYIGKQELNKYSNNQLAKFESMGILVFGSTDNIRIIKLIP
ncbi:MAG: DUF2298 domain-containing protein [Chloroflexota bacterium]|nr:DUF2298 domain-containing protein [Chloroflexota bacterium]MED6296471.1 DUF2298 domain-containing protein [Chloroflexota bacterium]